MCPRDCVLRVLSLVVAAIVLFSTTASAASVVQQPKLLILRLSPQEPARDLDDIPDKWRTARTGEYQAPQMEIHLLKSQISPDEKYYMNDYKYSRPDYYAKAMPPAIGEEEAFARLEKSRKKAPEDEDKEESREKVRKDEGVDDKLDNIVMPDRIHLPIGFRNIIDVPAFCREGETLDSAGRCREFLECKLSVNLTEIIVIFGDHPCGLVILTEE